MSKIVQLRSGDIITFSMIKSGIFGDVYSSVVVDSIIGYDVARLIDNGVNEKHANFYTFFKDTVNNINDPSVYQYLALKPDSTKNTIIVIGGPWINQDSIKISKTQDVTLHLHNFEEYKRASLETFLANANISYTFDKTE